jgi:hypothetical protein
VVPDQHGNFSKPDDDGEVSILLASGNEWRPFAPDPNAFEWSDIGIAAARIPRFNGQLSPKYACKLSDNYVLGQHLCLCSDLAQVLAPNLPIDVQLAIHLHDGEEPVAGLGDPSAPVKHSPRFRSSFKEYFGPILDAIADRAGFSRALLHGDPVVKRFDKMTYCIENFHLRGIGTSEGLAVPPRHIDGNGKFRVWTTLEAYENWMDTLAFLFALRQKEGESNG